MERSDRSGEKRPRRVTRETRTARRRRHPADGEARIHRRSARARHENEPLLAPPPPIPSAHAPNHQLTASATFRAGIAYHALKWTSVDGKACVSLLVRVTGAVLLELVSTHQTKLDTAGLPRARATRFGSAIAKVNPQSAADLVPLWASRASANATRDVEFYQRVLGARLVFSDDYARADDDEGGGGGGGGGGKKSGSGRKSGGGDDDDNARRRLRRRGGGGGGGAVGTPGF